MGSPATPITPPTAPTGATATPAVVPSSVHSNEDTIFNRIQAKMSANVPPEPASTTPADPLSTEQAPGATPPGAGAGEPAPVTGEVNLEDLDFSESAPKPPQAPPAEAGKDGRDPAEIEKELKSEIERLTGEGATDKVLWDKIGSIVMSHPRGQRMMQGLRLHQALMEAPKEDGTGGLGRLPSVEEIKQGDSALRDMMQLQHDLQNDPANFVTNMFGIAENGMSWLGSPQRAVEVAARIPDFILKAYDQTQSPVYSQMIGAMATPIISRMFDHQYKQAMALPPGQTREIVLYSLQVAEHNIVGEARQLPQQGQQVNGAPQPQTTDPRYQQLEQQFKQTHRELNQLRQQGQQQFAQTVNNTNRGATIKAVDKVLDHIGVSKVFSEEMLAPHRYALAQLIESELPRINGTGYENYLRAVTDAANQRLPLGQALGLYKNLIENGIRVSPAFRERLNALVRSAGEMSTTRTSARVQSQGQVGPSGAGAPAASSVLPTGPKVDRLPGESQEDYYTRRLGSKMRA